MQINLSVSGLDDLDLNTVIGERVEVIQTGDEETEEVGVQVTLADMVAQKLADKLFSEMDYDARREIRDAIKKIREEIIRTKVTPVIEAALLEPMQLTNTFGEPVGKAVTMREMIVSETKRAVTSGDRRHGTGESLLQKTIREQVAHALARELNLEIAEAKKDVVEAVRKKAAEFVSEAVLAKKVGR